MDCVRGFEEEDGRCVKGTRRGSIFFAFFVVILIFAVAVLCPLITYLFYKKHKEEVVDVLKSRSNQMSQNYDLGKHKPAQNQ